MKHSYLKILVGLLCYCVASQVIAASLSYQIDSDILATEKNQKIGELSYQGDLYKIFSEQKVYVHKLLKIMDVSKKLLTSEVIERINQPYTHSLEALLAYSRGLQLLDRGKHQQARLSFKYARLLDPVFSKARQSELYAAKYNYSLGSLLQSALNSERSNNVKTTSLLKRTYKLKAKPLNTPSFYPNADPIDDATVAVDIMLNVQAWPQYAANTFNQAVAENINPDAAFMASLMGLQSPQAAILTPLILAGLQQGLSAKRIADIAQQLADSGTCQ